MTKYCIVYEPYVHDKEIYQDAFSQWVMSESNQEFNVSKRGDIMFKEPYEVFLVWLLVCFWDP